MKPADVNFDYVKHTVYLTLSGSRAYGTFTPESDHDYKGVIIPPQHLSDGCLLPFKGSGEPTSLLNERVFEQKQALDGYGTDSVAYDIRKFFRLALGCNPNIIETLWVPEKFIVINSKYGEALRGVRKDFLSKKALESFKGYAFSQLKRMKLHKAWSDKEKTGEIPEKPLRVNFGLPHEPKYPKDQLNSILAFPSELLLESERDYIFKERAYFKDKLRYDKWRSWKENRNPKRAADEKKYGIDLKHALHFVRLLMMCEEILIKQEVVVFRPDAEFLMNIRNGGWTYEQIIEWADAQVLKLGELSKTTKLQDFPPIQELNELCVSLVREAREDSKFGL